MLAGKRELENRGSKMGRFDGVMIIGIAGGTGSGKTTLLRCINFLETADHGQMILDGETLLDTTNNLCDSESKLREKRLNFGLVFQSFNLFPQYSVLKNVTLAPVLQLEDKLKVKNTELIKQGIGFFQRKRRFGFFSSPRKGGTGGFLFPICHISWRKKK